jgi:hypothetical protein
MADLQEPNHGLASNARRRRGVRGDRRRKIPRPHHLKKEATAGRFSLRGPGAAWIGAESGNQIALGSHGQTGKESDAVPRWRAVCGGGGRWEDESIRLADLEANVRRIWLVNREDPRERRACRSVHQDPPIALLIQAARA